MNVVVIRGRLSSDPVRRQLASGAEMVSMEISTTTPDGVLTVPAAWFDPPDSAVFGAGDEVLVAGVVKRRFFRGPAGTQSRTEVVVAEACRGSDRRRSARLLARAVAALGPVSPGGAETERTRASG
jgi:single-strand DNA-binding protein